MRMTSTYFNISDKMKEIGNSSIKYIEEKLHVAKQNIEPYVPTAVHCTKTATLLLITGIALGALGHLATYLPVVDITEAFTLGFLFRHPEKCSETTIVITTVALAAFQILLPVCSLAPISKLSLYATAILIAKRN